MQIIIDILEDDYKEVKEDTYSGTPFENRVFSAIANGTLLPKGHGRIIDENKITRCEQVGLIIKDGNTTCCFVTDAPTIIEADKAESEAK